jgi:hypothetical protein
MNKNNNNNIINIKKKNEENDKNNLKTTINYFKNRTNKKDFIQAISPMKTQRVQTAKNKNKHFLSYLKSDIIEMDDLIQNLKVILIHFQDENDPILLNKDFKNQINFIENYEKKNLNFYFDLSQKPKNLESLYNEYSCNNKEDLIVNLNIENNFIKLFLNQLNILFFLLNLKHYNSNAEFINQFKESLSLFKNIKFCIEKINKKFNVVNSSNNLNSEFKKNFLAQSQKIKKTSTFNNMQTFNEENFNENNYFNAENNFNENNNNNESTKFIDEFLSEIIPMKSFNEFLEIELEENPINEGLQKIKNLFYFYNEQSFKLFVDFIIEKLKINNNPLLNKTKLVLNNNISDGIENAALIRKIIEDYFESLKSENEKLKKELEKMQKIDENKSKEIEIFKKKMEDFNNRDYKTYFDEFKKENTKFLNDIKIIEKKRNEDLYEKLQIKTEKNDALKSLIKKLENEIEVLNKKLDFNLRIPYKQSDDYYQALVRQFDDMKNGFQDEIVDLTNHYNNKKFKLQKKISSLEDEKQTANALKNVLIKRLNDIEKYFSK